MRLKSPAQSLKILEAAARLFTTHRFHEARMEDIAALAQVGKGTLYRYFKDKEELYLALLNQASSGLQARLSQAHDPSLPPAEQLELVVAALLAYFDEEPHVLDLITHAEAFLRPGTELPWQRTRKKTMALIRTIFQEAEQTGAFAFADVESAILMLLGGLRAVIRFGTTPRPPSLARSLVLSFLGGYRTGISSAPGR
ncbi:MAG: TetR/AcrR family transcriptional regulator [Gemmataceae bacterium]